MSKNLVVRRHRCPVAIPPANRSYLRTGLVALWVAGTVASAWAQPRQGADPQACPHGAATVQGATPADFADLCAGIDSALAFLARHQMRASAPLAFVVAPRLPQEAGPTAAGCYIERRRQVYVLPYAVFRQAKTWFGLGITREMYRLLAAHESAHAVAACNFKIPSPSIQAKEYLAYVTMFSVMPPAMRTQALRAVQPQGFSSLDRFTPLLYLFDPMRFGAEAYQHFSNAPDPHALVQDILHGRALQD